MIMDSRSPLGERGLKSPYQHDLIIVTSRSPLGERGLKYHHVILINRKEQSRSPLGERGLK